MSGYTKGEWYAVGGAVEHVRDDVADICYCYPSSFGQEHLGRSTEETFANAQLIAMAPEMLRVLRLMVKHAVAPEDLMKRARFTIKYATWRPRRK